MKEEEEDRWRYPESHHQVGWEQLGLGMKPFVEAARQHRCGQRSNGDVLDVCSDEALERRSPNHWPPEEVEEMESDISVEGVPVEVSVDDQLEVAKEEVAARGNHPGIVVGEEEAVEVDDHAGDD